MKTTANLRGAQATVVAAPDRPTVVDWWGNVRRLVDRGCRLLDAEDYRAWLAHCSQEFRYTIQTFSQEIRRDVIWLQKDRDGLALLFDQIPMHERYKGNFRRIVGWTDVTAEDPTSSVLAESAICVYHFDLYGESKLYCTAKYRDELLVERGQLVLQSRVVVMDTRRLPFASHVPI